MLLEKTCPCRHFSSNFPGFRGEKSGDRCSKSSSSLGVKPPPKPRTAWATASTLTCRSVKVSSGTWHRSLIRVRCVAAARVLLSVSRSLLLAQGDPLTSAFMTPGVGAPGTMSWRRMSAAGQSSLPTVDGDVTRLRRVHRDATAPFSSTSPTVFRSCRDLHRGEAAGPLTVTVGLSRSTWIGAGQPVAWTCWRWNLLSVGRQTVRTRSLLMTATALWISMLAAARTPQTCCGYPAQVPAGRSGDQPSGAARSQSRTVQLRISSFAFGSDRST